SARAAFTWRPGSARSSPRPAPIRGWVTSVSISCAPATRRRASWTRSRRAISSSSGGSSDAWTRAALPPPARAPATDRGRAIAVDATSAAKPTAAGGPQTAAAMSDTSQKGGALPLWERLLRSLEAGKEAGGQPDGETSSGLYVVDREPYPVVD